MKPTNAIQERVYEFLKQYPPFNLVEQNQLRKLASQARVLYLEPDQVLFQQGDPAQDYFYVVRQGSVVLQRVVNEKQQLVDVCDEGDVFGVRALIAQKSYHSTAKAAEETLVYAIPSALFQPILSSNTDVALFFAAGFAAGMTPSQIDTKKARVDLSGDGRSTQRVTHLDEVVKVDTGKNLVTCPPDTSIRLAAQIMSDKNSSFILITNEQEQPLGIVTDTNMRKRVVAGHVAISDSIDTIMSSPVITTVPDPPLADALINMIRHNIKHLCVTESGTTESKVLGVLTEHDLLLAQGDNPAVLVSEIRKANTVESLPRIRDRAEELLLKYLEQEVSIAFISNIITEINDAIIVRALQHAEATLGEPPLRYCWLSLGSEGREEQLLRTDQDNALIFENTNEATEKQAQIYFLKLANVVVKVLEDCGFERCPADMMASNPQWCQPLHTWERYFHNWIHQPTEDALLHASIFFDYRPVHGDFDLARELTDYIYEHISQERIFLPFLAKHALQSPPPLSFFRSFIVERSGEHKDLFDIKLRAMTPLVDAARVLTLDNRITGENNTFKRFEKLAKLETQNELLYQEAAMAYEIMMRHRALDGLRNRNSGRYLNPDHLNKLERQTLRNTFKPIADIQELLQVRFQLNYLG